MINKIIDAISISIDSEFGIGYNIHTESISQGLKEPCFSIFCLNPTNKLFRDKKYFRNNQFCIQYFPSTDEPKSECNSVLERLYSCLELVNMNGDTIRGTKMKGEIVDGVLNFFLNYDLFVYKVQEKILMEGLKTQNNISKE